MPIVLVRIDDRLIHGQVTVGWGSFLNPDRILLVSNEIAQDKWEKDLFESCAPFNIAVSILPVKEAAETLINNYFAHERIIILAENPGIINELLREGVSFPQVNIGGMHFRENKKKLLSYIYVDEDDIAHFRRIQEHKIALVCQDLPQAKKENLADMLDKL
ncbi:PTS system mannose/fructose/N-acetylgalactosamine-transporter subunit IIB [candidate division KSB1 bacterium]